MYLDILILLLICPLVFRQSGYCVLPKDENIYPAILLKEQHPVEIKYRFKDIKHIAGNKCPLCGGNLFFKYEEY